MVSPRLSIITDAIGYDEPVIPRYFPGLLLAACALAQPPAPIDPQRVQDQQTMT
jgi:hypothetical protein